MEPTTLDGLGLLDGTHVFDVSVTANGVAVHRFDGALTIILTVHGLFETGIFALR